MTEATLLALFKRLLHEGDYTDLSGVKDHRWITIDSGLDLNEDEYEAVKNELTE